MCPDILWQASFKFEIHSHFQGVEDSEDSSDSESDFSSSDVKKGFVAVEWLTNSRIQIVADNQVSLIYFNEI